MFGKLSLSAIPYDNLITLSAVVGAVLLGLVILGLITYYRKWTYLYQEWLTSLDPKKIGIMYIILALVMLLRGFSDAILMRSQQAVAAGGSLGFLAPEHFDQIFSAHGSIMIVFMAMPFLVGIDEYRGAAANRGPRCRLSLDEFAQSLANRSRGAAGHGIFGCG